MDINLHFEITPAGRVKFNWQSNDVKLEFYKGRNSARKASTIEAVGKAFIAIANKAKELNQYQ